MRSRAPLKRPCARAACATGCWAGFQFYQRAEVKDALAYVRLAIFPDDDIALLRVINTPPRGIGKTTVDSLSAIAREEDASLWVALGKILDGASTGRAIAPLKDFRTADRGLAEGGRHGRRPRNCCNRF